MGMYSPQVLQQMPILKTYNGSSPTAATPFDTANMARLRDWMGRAQNGGIQDYLNFQGLYNTVADNPTDSADQRSLMLQRLANSGGQDIIDYYKAGFQPSANPLQSVAPAPATTPTITDRRQSVPSLPQVGGTPQMMIANNTAETPYMNSVAPAPRSTPTGAPTQTAARGTATSTGMSNLMGSGSNLNVGSGGTYNPQYWQVDSTQNPYIDKSGGFSYGALPGMYNTLNQFLSQNMGSASGRANAMTDFMGNAFTSGYPGGMSQYLQGMVDLLGVPQAQYGNQMQGNAASTTGNLATGNGPQTALQKQTGDYLSQLLGGSGLTPEYVNAMRESVLKPSQDEIYAQANRAGQGQVAPSSGLTQELQRRNERDFNNQLIAQGFNQRGQLINQAMASGGQQFGQGLDLAQLQGALGQNAIGNSFNAMSQGGNLLNSYMGSLLGLQGNQQNYASNLANNYSGLAQNLLGNKTQQDYNNALLAQSQNQAMGSWLANLLPFLGQILNGKQQNPNSSSGGKPATNGTTAPTTGPTIPTGSGGRYQIPSLTDVMGVPPIPNYGNRGYNDYPDLSGVPDPGFDWAKYIADMGGSPDVSTTIDYGDGNPVYNNGFDANTWLQGTYGDPNWNGPNIDPSTGAFYSNNPQLFSWEDISWIYANGLQDLFGV